MMRAWTAAVMVVATGLLTAAGCNTSVTVSSSCPPAMPAKDAPCTTDSESCPYQDGPCTMTFTCDAAEHTWQIASSVCQPTAVDCWAATNGDICAIPGQSCGGGSECGGFFNECGDNHRWRASYAHGGDCCSGPENQCPSAPPSEGEPCDPCADLSTCDYPADCSNLSAICGPDGYWHVSIEDDCPPPPLDDCGLFGSPETCTAAPGCRRLVPGCGEPQLPAAGCFSKLACIASGCAQTQTCQEVVYDPCWNSECDACGAPTFVCL